VFVKEYLYTARALLRIAKSMTDETIANRLKALAAHTTSSGFARWNRPSRWRPRPAAPEHRQC
jgi:hypothetical protein